MGKIYKNAAELVGNTPLLEVGNIEKDLGPFSICLCGQMQTFGRTVTPAPT